MRAIFISGKDVITVTIEQLENKLLVDGKYTVQEYRRLLDAESGMPGLPGIFVQPASESFEASYRRLKMQFADTRIELQPRSSLDGIIELSPRIILPPVFERRKKNV